MVADEEEEEKEGAVDEAIAALARAASVLRGTSGASRVTIAALARDHQGLGMAWDWQGKGHARGNAKEASSVGVSLPWAAGVQQCEASA